MQRDGRQGDLLTVEKADHNDGSRALRAAKATGELFDLVESKDSRQSDPQQQTDGDAQADSTQRLIGAMATMKTLRDHRQRWRKVRGRRGTCSQQSGVEFDHAAQCNSKDAELRVMHTRTDADPQHACCQVRQLRNDEVKYNVDGVGGDSVSAGGEDADAGSAPGRVPAAGRQLSRQDAFKVRADEALVEKAREAYDESGGGVAGMQVRNLYLLSKLQGSESGCDSSASAGVLWESKLTSV